MRLTVALLSLLLIAATPSSRAQPTQEPIATPQAAGAAVTPEGNKPREQGDAGPRNAVVTQQPPQAQQLGKETADDNGQGEMLELNRRLTEYTGELARYTWALVIVGVVQLIVAGFQESMLLLVEIWELPHFTPPSSV